MPMERSLSRQFAVRRIDDGGAARVLDEVAAEEPLEIRVVHWFKNAPVSDSLAVTMRTPGHDRELVAGFLFTEDVIQTAAQLIEIRPLGPQPSNEIAAVLSKDVDLESWRMARNSFIQSSCGICGKKNSEAIADRFARPLDSPFHVSSRLIATLPDLLRAHQQGFSKTGGLHAAALVNARGEIEAAFEDIGRHNALDKLIGHCVLNGRMPLDNGLLFLTSRSSFELILKTIGARAPILATVGSPSSLAVETAREHALTLVGFVRDRRFNVYSGDWRIHSK